MRGLVVLTPFCPGSPVISVWVHQAAAVHGGHLEGSPTRSGEPTGRMPCCRAGDVGPAPPWAGGRGREAQSPASCMGLRGRAQDSDRRAADREAAG